MILKMILLDNAHGLSDGDLTTPCDIFCDVTEVSFNYEERYNADYLRITFKDGTKKTRYFLHESNAYLMNDEGKTIQKFTGIHVLDEPNYLAMMAE